MELKFYCDTRRHLVCLPYSVENLHQMARILSIKKSWYSRQGRLLHPHYDIPAYRFYEVQHLCITVRPRDILNIIKTGKYE